MQRETFSDYAIDIGYATHGQVRTICPQCASERKLEHQQEKDLVVTVEEGVWYCHHCGWSGYLRQSEKSKTKLKDNPKFYKASTSTDIRNFLSRRKIDLGWLDILDLKGYFKNNKEWIVFEYKLNGEIVNRKYRSLEKEFHQEKNGLSVFYNLDLASHEQKIVIVEGELDALSLMTAGYNNVISVPNGAPTPNTKDFHKALSFVDNSAKYLESKTFILAMDNDEPGKRLQDELSRRLGKENCKIVTWPLGCKDANDVLMKHGIEILSAAIEKAKPFPIDGVYSAEDLIADYEHLYLHGNDIGLSTGIKSLDEFYRVRRGCMTVVTGQPSHGKSNLMDSIVINLCKFNGWRFAMFSPEHYPLHDHMATLAQCFIQKPFYKWQEGRMTYDESIRAAEFIQSHIKFIALDNIATMETLNEKLRYVVKTFGVDGIVIDPWNEIDHKPEHYQNETQYTAIQLTRLRDFARKNNLHLWIVAHPTKLQKDKNGKYPVPTLYDISGSANFRNKTDMGLSVWRDIETNEVEIHVQKVKFRGTGKHGMTKLKYDMYTSQYY